VDGIHARWVSENDLNDNNSYKVKSLNDAS
jgi:hypothetical protein